MLFLLMTALLANTLAAIAHNYKKQKQVSKPNNCPLTNKCENEFIFKGNTRDDIIYFCSKQPGIYIIQCFITFRTKEDDAAFLKISW